MVQVSRGTDRPMCQNLAIPEFLAVPVRPAGPPPPQDLAAQDTLVAPTAPPQLRAELRSPPPLPDAVWLAGAWYWDGRAWLWHPGRWTMPPRPGLLWQPPAWVLDHRGVRLVPGGWGQHP